MESERFHIHPNMEVTTAFFSGGLVRKSSICNESGGCVCIHIQSRLQCEVTGISALGKSILAFDGKSG